MGTICAPSYAHILMDHFEWKFINHLKYLKFIDHVFFIWTGKKTYVVKFLNQLNTKPLSVTFEYKIRKEKSYF